MKIKILTDFDYSFDGVNPTHLKRGDFTEKFSVEQIEKLTKRGLVGVKSSKLKPEPKAEKPKTDVADDKGDDGKGDSEKNSGKGDDGKGDGFDDNDDENLGDGSEKSGESDKGEDKNTTK